LHHAQAADAAGRSTDALLKTGENHLLEVHDKFHSSGFMARHIHKNSSRRGEIELTIGEWQFQCAGDGIANAQRIAHFCLSGVVTKVGAISMALICAPRSASVWCCALRHNLHQVLFFSAISGKSSRNAGRFTASR